MPYCWKCKRTLTREPGRTTGIGPVCARKVALEILRQQEENPHDQLVEYDGGDIFIERLFSDTEVRPGVLESLQHTASGCRSNVAPFDMRKSPTGFNFGYAGSGPGCFALNVMLMFCKSKEDAYRIFQDFKNKFVATGRENRLVIPKTEIVQFITGHGCEVVTQHAKK